MEGRFFWDKKAISRKSPMDSVVKAFVEDKIEVLLDVIPDLNKMSLVDFGCGNGRFLYYLKNITRQSAGLDFSSVMIEKAKNYVDVPLYVIDGLNPKFKDNQFDVSFAACYLHNLKNPRRALNEMKRTASKYVILIEPNPLNPIIFWFNFFSSEERFLSTLKFTKKHLKRLYKEIGLNIAHCSKQGFVTPNRTPKFLVPILKKMNFLNFVGCYIIIVGVKNEV